MNIADTANNISGGRARPYVNRQSEDQIGKVHYASPKVETIRGAALIELIEIRVVEVRESLSAATYYLWGMATSPVSASHNVKRDQTQIVKMAMLIINQKHYMGRCKMS